MSHLSVGRIFDDIWVIFQQRDTEEAVKVRWLVLYPCKNVLIGLVCL